MKKLTIFLSVIFTLSVSGQNISISKDTVTFYNFWVHQEASDSINIYNNDSSVLSLDSIYSQNYIFDLMATYNDSIVNLALMYYQNMVHLDLQIPPNDSIKIVFRLFVPIIKSFTTTDIYTDTISIFNNSLNNPTQRITALTDITLGSNEENEILDNFELSQNYPNPFNPTTKIKYSIPTSPFNPSPYQGAGNVERLVTIKIYNILGREIATLVNEEKPPGVYEVEFDARLSNSQGSSLASGIYIYQVKSGGFTASKKFVLMK